MKIYIVKQYSTSGGLQSVSTFDSELDVIEYVSTSPNQSSYYRIEKAEIETDPIQSISEPSPVNEPDYESTYDVLGRF